MVVEYNLNPRSTGLGQAYRQRVLVIDDNASDRLLAEANFLAHGMNADAVSDGNQALDYLRRTKYDAVICDTRLAAGVHGPDLVDRLREVHQGPIIGTSTDDNPDLVQSWGLKAVRFIPKSFGQYSGYVARIRDLLKGE